MTDRENNGRVWGIVWPEVFPWILLFRTFRIAISFRLLLLGAVGMVAMFFGSTLICNIYSCDKEVKGHAAAATIQNTDWYSHPIIDFDLDGGWKAEKQSGETNNFGLGVSIGLWTILVWGFLGTAISRAAVVQLVTGGRVSLREMLTFALKKWRAAIAAPLMPFLAMLFLAIPILLLGLLLRIEGLAWIGAVAWPIAILAGFVITMLTLVLVFGWPLMISAIATEGSDSFDSLSRTYSYLYQRPLHYLFYVILATLFGTLCWFFVAFFANMVLESTQWTVNWVMLGADTGHLEGPFEIIRAWVVIFKLLVMGFSATYFWTAAVAIYLLLRRNADAVELDEIYHENEAIARELPKIVPDEQDAPTAEA